MRIVGRGRAGGAFAQALAQRGWTVDLVGGHGPQLAAAGVDLVLICVPDSAVVDVARATPPGPAVVAHVAGALGLDALAPHERVGAVHPLVSMPTAELGAERLLGGASFAVAGDPICAELVAALGGRAIDVPDDARVGYHAAAVIASNHLVALLGQAERVAAEVGVPLDAYLGLVRGTIDNVASLGPAGALTGPASRGDLVTIGRHLDELAPEESAAYAAMMELCRRLVDDD